MTATEEFTEPVSKIIPMIDSLTSLEREQVCQYLYSQEIDEDEFWNEWGPIVEKRVRDFDSGKSAGVPGEEAMARLREKYG